MKYDGPRLSLRRFKSEKNFERTNSNHVHYRNHRNRHKQSHKVKPKLALVMSVIFHTWLPRSYSNNTLLTAGCCKSELSYLKHWYRVLCPGLVKPILEHSWRRSWYMKLFHTPRTYFLLITRLWKHNSCSGVIFIPGKNLKALSRAFMNSFLHLSAHKSTTWNQNTYIKFHWLLLADRSDHIYLRSVTSWGIVCYPITSTSRFWMCHSISWMVLCQAFLSLLPLPAPPSKLSSPVAP